MKLFLSILFLSFYSQIILSEIRPYYETYMWDKNPNYNVNTDRSEDIIAIKDKLIRFQLNHFTIS